MNLGAFSVSLAVKDLAASKAFYARLGFEPFAGEESHNFLILKNGEHVIGLFQGMFDGNILTFNPGWDQAGQTVEPYTDAREIQSELQAAGVPLMSEIEAGTEGPASFMLQDPDGNVILIDQHR